MEDVRPRRSVSRTIALAVVWALLSLLCLVASILHHLDTEPGRAAVAEEATAIVSGLIAGELQIDRVDVLTPSHVELSGVSLWHDGREVARVGHLEVTLDPWALLDGEVHLTEVRVVDPRAFVGTGESGEEMALLQAVALVDPGSDDEEESSPISVAVDAFEVTGAEVDGLDDGLRVQDVAVSGSLRFDRTLAVEIGAARGDLARDERVLASLASLTTHLDLAPGGRSEAALRVESGDDYAELDAALEWTEEGPGALEAELRFDASPALAETFEIAGVSDTVSSPVRGVLRANGTLDHFAVEGSVETDGGSVAISGGLEGEEVSARVATAGLSLGDIVPSLGRSSASGEVEARLAPVSGPERNVTLVARDVHYDEWTVPEATVHATLSEDGSITVSEVSLPHLEEGGGHLNVSGTIGVDGSVDARVDARIPQIARDPNLRRLAPGVRAGVSADVRVRIDGGDEATIAASGSVRADHFRAPGIAAEQVRVRGSMHGRLASPVLDVDVVASGIAAGDVVIRDTTLHVTGGPRDYRAGGTVTLATGEQLELDATAEVRGGEYFADATLTVRGFWPDPVRVVLRRMHLVPERYVSFESLSAESTGLSLGAAGRYSFASDSDLRATIATLDLEKLGEALDRPGVTGNAEGEVHFGGTTRLPELEVRARLSEVATGFFELPEVQVDAALSSDRGQVSARAHADAAGYGRVDVSGEGTLGEGREIVARLRAGTYDLSVGLDDVPATLLSLASPELPPFDGTVDVNARLRGAIDAPVITVTADVDDFAAPGFDPLAFDLRAEYERGEATLTVTADDADGRLATARAVAPIDLPALVAGAAFYPLASDLTIDVSVPSHRLDRLPAPLTLPIPAHGTAEIHLRRAGGATTLTADGRIDRFEDALAEAGCAPGPVPGLRYHVETRDGRTVLDVHGDVSGARVGDLRAEAPTPIDDWIRDGFPEDLPAVSLEASIEGLELAQIPVACSAASGVASLHLTAEQLLTPDPRVQLEGGIDALVVEGSAPVDLRVSGDLGAEGATVTARMDDAGREILSLSARAPLTLGEDGLSPALADAPFEAELRLDDAPAGPILEPLPMIAQARGVLDGHLVARGTTLEDVSADGEIRLRDVSFVITDPIIRVDRLGGAIGFERQGVVLRNLRLRDRDGTLSADGRIGLSGIMPSTVQLAIEMDEWPLRNEGVPFAYMSSEIDVEGQLGDEREIRATFDDFSIRLPEVSGNLVQPLDQHPDVIYEDQPGFARDGSGADEDHGEDDTDEEETIPFRVIVDATQPFWIRRDDFAIQLTADLRIDSDANGVRMTGPVVVKRGYISLVGRSFDFERGEIVFDGGSRVDPTLDLTAVHTLQSRETVTVSITGHLTDPEIRFSTTVPGVQSEAEIIDLLVSGHGGSTRDAKDQAISVLGGMAAGILSTITRRAAGNYIPRLSIDAGAAGSTRIRAGIAADALIPSFLEGVVESAYVEGFVGTSEEQTSGSGETTDTGARGGFLIELYWPRSIVTTGSYEQPSNWSLDVTWEP